MSTHDEHEAAYRSRLCTHCGANPGEFCMTKFGNVCQWSHLVRRPQEDVYRRPHQKVRALCCECGTLRTVDRSFRRRDDNDTHDGRHSDPQGRGWRMTGTLKCSVCTTNTRQAMLRDELDAQSRDRLEAEMMGWRERWNQLR